MDGPTFYDENDVFQSYVQSRQRVDSPNKTLEKPVIMDLVGTLADKRILDLGCGDAAFGREALQLGCRRYVGVEGSLNMVAAAKMTLEGTAGQVVHATVEAWDYPPNAFDLVVARLVLHYVQNVDPVFANIYRTLVEHGDFVFSVEHPIITSCGRGWQPGSARKDWLVDDYFETGRRITSWMGGNVSKFHRTVEDYFVAAQRAGFLVQHLREGRPSREYFEEESTYQRRKRIPLFLMMALHKDK